MTAQELDDVVEGIAEALRDHVDRTIAPVLMRLSALEARPVLHGRDGLPGVPGPHGEKGLQGDPGPIGPAGRDGKDADMADVQALKDQIKQLQDGYDDLVNSSVTRIALQSVVDERVAKSLDGFTIPKGQPASVDDLAPIVAAEVTKAIAALPVPKDGRDGKDGTSVTLDDVAPLIRQELSALPQPKDGSSVTVEDVRPLIAQEVKAAVATLPVPVDGKDGRSVTAEDVLPIIAAEVTKAVAALPIPKDGTGVAGAVIDRDGCLVLTLSDGTARNLGAVVGKDADVDGLRAFIVNEIAKWPVPKDGANGRDGIDGKDGADGERGADGLGFEDLNCEVRDDGVYGVFQRGDLRKEVRFPVPMYRGIWKEGDTYQPGDTVTWAGSAWIAKAQTVAKPGINTPESRAWQLCVKKGTDGKSGPPGPQGPQGLKGPQGDRGPERW